MCERGGAGRVRNAAFPSFHVLWIMFLARVIRPAWLGVFCAAAVIVSCITTGMHYIPDVLVPLDRARIEWSRGGCTSVFALSDNPNNRHHDLISEDEMKVRIAILLLAAATAGAAQSSSGYVFFAPGGQTMFGSTMTMLNAGGGVDAHITHGLGANVELSALWPADYPSGVVGLVSAGPTYRIPLRHERIEPFVAGGYSLMFRGGHANLGYLGGGVNYWAWKKVGFRLEFRDHIRQGPVNFWLFRFGVAFR
jgi:hypothetical protein